MASRALFPELNESMAFIRPMEPIEMISSKSTEAILPEVVYFLAIWATSLRLCSISRSLACVSPSLHLWIYSDSSSSLSGFGKEAKVPRKKAVNGAHPSKAVFYILCGLQKKCERFLQKKLPNTTAADK